MNRTVEIVKIIVSIFVIVMVGVGVIIYMSEDGEGSTSSTVHDKKITDNINSVAINWNSDDVKIMKSPDNNIRIVEKNANSNKHRLSYEVKNDKLIINKKREGFFIFNFNIRRSNLELYLPDKEYEEIKLNFTSGDYEVYDVKTKKLDIYFTSGDISLEGVTAKELEIDYTSGDVEFNGSAEKVDLESTSGDSKIKTSTMLKELDVDITSGSAEVYIPENNGFITNVKASSGDFSGDFEYKTDGNKYYYKEGGPEFKVNLTSGSVKIKRN